MKKVLIVEDEYSEVQTAFEYVNDIYLSNGLDLKNLAKSQDIDFSKLCDYDYIFGYNFGKKEPKGRIWYFEENRRGEYPDW